MSPPTYSIGALLRYLFKWAMLATIIAALAGTASAALLAALDWATAVREQHAQLIWLLPVAGFAVGWVYMKYGADVEGGNNLLLERIREPGQTVPLRMAPMIWGATVVSHLFGASVGREGTAVQMGGALADQISHRARLVGADRRIVLMAGISAGFASLFGTPWAGALFGLEVLAVGSLRKQALLPCIVAAWLADGVSQAWGAHHTHYSVPVLPPVSGSMLSSALLAGVAFGLMAWLFVRSTHGFGAWTKRRLAYAPWRPFAGGLVVALVVWGLDAHRYIGLGIPVIQQAFDQPVHTLDFLAKAAMTTLSLGTGFKGGEVTPLFFIGATLGNTLAPLLSMPLGMGAALGFAAVFAGAANTPIAATVMAMELFGLSIGPYAALACCAAYLTSGRAGIYAGQRLRIPPNE